MKTFLTSLLVAAILALSVPQAQAPPEPEPQFVTCVMTWICLGLFAACVVACYYHAWNSDYSGPTNAPPALPPLTPDDPPDTQTNLPPLCTNLPPITVNALQAVQHLDATPYAWLDCSSNLVTDLYRTTIQTATSPAGPWSTAYVVTLWQSAYGSTALVEDGAGNALATNYSRRAGNGSVTNFAPLELAHDQPSKFYRAKP